MRFLILSFFYLFVSLEGTAQLTPMQERAVDSLKNIIKSSAHDTLKINAYQTWDDLIYNFDMNLDEELNRKIIGLAESNLKKNTLSGPEIHTFKKDLAAGLNTLATILTSQGDLGKSLDFQNKSLKLSDELGDKKGMANSLNNIGAIYEQKGDCPRAIEYYTHSLKLREEMGDDKGVALALNNIGVIYYDLADYKKAMEYHMRSLKARKASGDNAGVGMSYSNIGAVYHMQKDLEKAIEFFIKGLKIQEENNDAKAVAMSLNNIGAIYQEKKDYEKAMEFFEKSLKAVDHVEHSQGIAMTLNNIGNIHFAVGNYEKAYEYNKKALIAAQKSSSSLMIKDAANSLFNYYKKTGKYTDALEMYELFIIMRDSVQNENNQKEVLQQEMQYNYEKKKALDEKEHEKQIAISTEQKNKQRIITYASATGLALVILFSIFVFNRLRITNRQKSIIEEQKNTVEEKQKEIVDSITYAKRLQEAILPPENFVKEHLKQSFIFYKPKDIVAGDFYWMELKEDLLFIAAADCTGHGVPGAIVSVVCSNALNRALMEFGITDPGKILDKTRELVLETFSKSDTDVKDGMDISLLSIDRKSNTIKWAGAYNPLWYIQNKEIKEIKANKQSIGKTETPVPFITHSIELNAGDTLFLFTDGLADQFGGEKGKKFKYKPMKELFLKNADLSPEQQKSELEIVFKNWTGRFEQVDDICIIGIKL